MARVFFTNNLQRHIPCPRAEATGATLCEVLKAAWFVPVIKDERRIPVDGRVVVTRTRDGGKTFDVDRSGRSLAFGSTTGSCWVSDDQGDHWQCLGEHLPPIYCVRFA
jgi:hypothetical protein